jgi:hypothetical protein
MLCESPPLLITMLPEPNLIGSSKVKTRFLLGATAVLLSIGVSFSNLGAVLSGGLNMRDFPK